VVATGAKAAAEPTRARRTAVNFILIAIFIIIIGYLSPLDIGGEEPTGMVTCLHYNASCLLDTSTYARPVMEEARKLVVRREVPFVHQGIHD
jgi:hypothetical protein